jgi:hypothetical protein
LNLDFSSVEGGDLIPEGTYNVVIDKVEARPSSNPNNNSPNLNWQCTIADGEHKNRKVFMTTGTGQNALWKLKDTLEALGISTEGLSVVTDDSSNLIIQPRLSGLPATAIIKHREWQGKMRAGIESLQGKNGASPNGGPQFR